MGRTVINETENKQTVILNDSPEGVEGGYFDSLMEWHELSGEAPETPAVYVGKTFKVREDWTPAVASAYTVLPIFGRRVDSEATVQRAYIVYMTAYSTGRLSVQQVNENLISPVAVSDIIDGNGNITDYGGFCRFQLTIGIPALLKEMFDKLFIEV